jgi:hypothetical protein
MLDRRTMIAATAAMTLGGRAAGEQLPRARLFGDALDPAGDDSGRIVPAPPPGYWPYSGVSGPGRPATPASIGQGWTSGLPEVSYSGPDRPRYPIAPWGDRASAQAVRDGLLPPLRPIHHVHIRDTIVKPGPDGWYYMTGSTGDNIWATNDGVELWRSRDLDRWEYRGLVWSIERDGGWERGWRMRKGVAFRALWAPEIHYLRGNWYICHSISRGGLAVLRSTSGTADGPYVHAFSPDAPIRGGIDATLFEDADGSVWLTAGSASEIVRLKHDLSGLAGDWRQMLAADPAVAAKGKNRFGYEGATLFRRDGRYHLGVVQKHDLRYSFDMWTAPTVTGPYGYSGEVPCCGGGNFLRDRDGQWWVTFFGNDKRSPFREMPGLARITFDDEGHIAFAADQPFTYTV